MKARLLVLGLDGASWDVIRGLGPRRLPHLHRLTAEGASAPLRSTTPPMTLPAWSSVLTGCRPGKHGIYDFLVRPPGQRSLALQDSSWRRVPTIHQVLRARGKSTASLLVPTTWPPPPGSGTVIAGFDSPVATGVSRAHCHPPALYDDVVARFGGLAFADFQEGALDEAWFAMARAKLLAEIERKRRVTDWLLDAQDWDCLVIVFGESDTAAHHGWAFHDPSSPRHQPGDAALLGDVYAALDRAVGALAPRADTTVICSDHGFGGAGTTAIFLNRFLESRGWLRFLPHGRAGATGDRLRRLATRLPTERLVRALPPSLLAAAETHARTGDLDWTATRAWSDELNYAATIHLNKAGRERGGLDVDEPRLIADLLAWEIDGHRVVEAVHRADDLHGPDRAPGAPDLVLDLALPGGYSFVVLPSARSSPGQLHRRLAPAEWMGGKGLGPNGSHRQHGVLILHGAGVRPCTVDQAGVEDVMPTCLALLGEAIPDHVDGRVLREAVAASPRFTEGFAPRAVPRPPSAAVDAQVRGRLRRLGYLD